MARKQKKPQRASPRPPTTSVEDQAATIRARMVAGRTLGALRSAKKLHKASPGPTTEQLLIEAYAARIDGLSAGAMNDEVTALLALVRKSFPAEAERWNTVERSHARRAGDLSDLLRDWTNPELDTSARAELSRQLQLETSDPGQITAAGILAPEDQLARAAVALQTALAEAAAGCLGDAARDGLRAVGRRSPLRPWREFVLALGAAHDGDRDSAKKHLAAIPADSGAGLLVSPLARLLGVEAPDPSIGPAETELLRQATNGGFELTQQLDLIESAARAAKRSSKPPPVLRDWFPKLAVLDRDLALRFCGWTISGLDESWFDFVQRCLPGYEGLRILALIHQQDDPLEVLITWSLWLRDGDETTLRRESDEALALALDEMGRVAAQIKRLFEIIPLSVCDLISPVKVHAACDELSEDPDPWGPDFDTLLMALSGLFRALATHTDRNPESNDLGLELQVYACRLSPSSARMQALLPRLAEQPERNQEFCAQWRRLQPDNVEPVLFQIRAAERKSANKRARELIAEAKDIDALHAEVRAAEFRIDLLNLHKHLRSRAWRACADDLERLEASAVTSGPQRQAYITAARAYLECAQKVSGARPPGDRALLEKAGGDHRAATIMRLVRCLMTRQKLLLEPDATTSPASRITELIGVMQVASAVQGCGEEVLGCGSWIDDCQASDLPTDLDKLESLCRFAAADGHRSLHYLAAGIGLRQDGPRLARFLWHRSRALSATHEFLSAQTCERLASHFAELTQDREVTAAIGQTPSMDWFYDDGPNERAEDPALIAELLATERAAADTLEQRCAERRPKTDGQLHFPFELF